MFKEFKEFALKGNMLDLAVGIIIGAAFGAIITSLVKDVIMPPLGLITGNIDFKNMMWVLKDGKVPGPYPTPEAAQAAGAVAIAYGAFLNNIISFFAVAFSVFFMVKGFNRIKRKQLEEPAAPAKASNEEVLLTEIRDLLAKGV